MVLPSLCLLRRKHERDPSEDENSRQDTQPNALPSSTALGTAPSNVARMQRHGCWCQQFGDTQAARLAGRGEPDRTTQEADTPISLEPEKCVGNTISSFIERSLQGVNGLTEKLGT